MIIQNEWVGLKDLLKLLKELPQWSFSTKYLNIRLDTRFIQGDYGCLIKDDKGNILSLDDIRKSRGGMNKC
jgi:hypothetical protein